ncbi:hypothetical protein [Sphingobacterium sp.]|uniref:hypothetical protein n=1 Tax=Sphingobacterium sp. TaxID=341027 RepID=UPI002FDDB7D1
MKKIIYPLILPLAIAGGLALASHEIKSETLKKSTPKPRSAVDMKTENKKWEASPDGIKFKKWKASPQGTKVLDSAAKIRNQVKDSTNIEAVITSLYLPLGSQLGFGVMIRINGEDYILSFGLENSNDFQQLHSLKVNDKIMIRSHSVMYAPKYSYPIVSGDYLERDGKIMYKRIPRQGGC